MTIALHALEVRQETRLRLIFSGPLDTGAFGYPAPTFYSVANVDGCAPSPTVQAALLVPNSPNVVELVFSLPILNGVLYTVTAVGVPSTDSTVTPSGSTLDLRWGAKIEKPNVEPLYQNRQRLLYFIDLLWNGADFQETATNDLDRIEGTANVSKALNRGVEADSLPWDDTYGAKARQYVDSPSTAAGTLKGSISAQLLRDPRVKSAPVKFEVDDEKTFIYANPVLISGEKIERVSIEVPNDT